MEELFFLACTIAVELPIALLFLHKENRQRVCMSVLGINMVSHPIIWYLLFTHHINWFALEISVALFESAVLAFLFPKNRLVAAFTGVFINSVTAYIGYLL